MILTRVYLLYYFLPGLLLLLLMRYARKRHYLGYSRLSAWQQRITPVSRLVYLPVGLQWLAFAFLILAVLDPVLSFAEERIQFRGLDIVLVVDLSSSMQQTLPMNAAEEERFRHIDPFFAPRGANPTRLDAVKTSIRAFANDRRHDRIGLVVFSSNAYVVSPMTLDYPYLSGYVDMMDHRTLIGEGLTAIGEGIYTSVQLVLKQNEKQQSLGDKLLIILTDGENNSGRSPIETVEWANQRDFKIYLIGVDIPRSPLTNRLIAAVQDGGGAYYDVRNQEQLDHAYWEIGALEKGDFVVNQYNRRVPFYHQAVLGCVICLALSLGLRGLAFFTELS